METTVIIANVPADDPRWQARLAKALREAGFPAFSIDPPKAS